MNHVLVAAAWWVFLVPAIVESFKLPGSVDTIPNPLTNPIECNRAGLDHSWLCDLTPALTTSEADMIEQSLTKLRDTTQHQCPNGEHHFYQLAVAIVDTLGPDVSPDEASNSLLHRWGIGTCNDGLLLLVATQDKTSSLSWRDGVNPGEGERPAITPYFEERLKASIHADLRKANSPANAIINAIESIREQLPVWKTEGKQRAPSWIWLLLGCMLLIYSATLLVTYVWFRTVVKARYQDSRSFIDDTPYGEQAELYVVSESEEERPHSYGT